LARPLIFDATPLIYVIRVSLSGALKKTVGPKFVPQSVYDELLKGELLGRPEASKIRELAERNEFIVVKPTDSSFVRRLIRIAAEGERKPLHAAEAEALALAKELQGTVISDDHVARSTAKLVQAELHGTGYLIGRMCREGHVSKEEAKAKVREMRREGWRLSEDDYRNIIDYLETL